MQYTRRQLRNSILVLLLLATLAVAEDRPELQPIKVNFQPGPEYADDVRMFQGIPGIARAPGGRLWAVWYGGGKTECEKNYVMLVTSADDGRTWSKLKAVLDPEPETVRAFDPTLWTDPNGRLWVFWAQAVSYCKSPSTWAITTENPDDENPTWSKPRRLFDGVMMNKPTVTKDGAWLFPASAWYQDKSSLVVKSTDRGLSFEVIGAAGIPDKKDRNADESMLIERENDLWFLVRTMYGIGQSSSTDGGKTWTPVVPSGIPHPVARFFIRRLASGNFLLVKHGPMDKVTGRSHLTAFLSDDDGKTWKGGLVFDDWGGISYPDGFQAPDGTIYIIYDFARWTYKKIQMATFTEADVLAGKDVSGKVRLRVLINQATGINPDVGEKNFKFADNKDGVEFKQSAKATLHADPDTQESDLFKRSVSLFTNRQYIAGPVPKLLEGKNLLRCGIESATIRCEKPGTVWVLTPSKGRNADSLADELVEQGFKKVSIPEFMLFGNSAGNICSVYQKDFKAGETLKLGKWGVVLH